jgi:transglutaminase-like putative cysteine protease
VARAVAPSGPATAPAASGSALRFTDDAEAHEFYFSPHDEPYLQKLRTQYKLDEVVAGAASDYEKVRAISRWVRGRWRHNGRSQPSRSDPISILEEAAQGKQFRCVEYSIVASGALNALDIRSRLLALKTADVETRKSGAGHVVVEAFLHDLNRWIMIDAQWDVIPVLDGKPLNAVELQRALAARAPGLGVDSRSAVDAREYFDWVEKYLFYFDVRFDQRFGQTRGRGVLMLVPVGAKEPTLFQRNSPISGITYTRSVRAFYATPATP